MIQPRSSKSDRFSLYLSSQLMYGITRIHRYQIISFQSEFNSIFNVINVIICVILSGHNLVISQRKLLKCNKNLSLLH